MMHVAKKLYIYELATENVCFERLLGVGESPTPDAPPVVDGTVKIYFPSKDEPSITSGLFVTGEIVGGNLEGIAFDTLGVRYQNNILSELRQKYGNPSKQDSVPVETEIGARFQAVEATWEFSNLLVSFNSAFGRIDSGIVVIDTPRGSAERTRRMKDVPAGRPL